MPTFDTGHLFLTFLTPVKAGATTDPTGATVSHEQLLRMRLNLLPTALQSPATRDVGVNSPFARNRQTHLCRMFVLEDVIYNGRNRKDAIATSLAGQDPINPQPVDRLNCAYLVFAADIDAVMDDGDDLPESLEPARQARVRDAYLRRLWATMEPELRAIYDHCVGFDKVSDAAGFARYLARCQVETTMPFNDYWITPPALKNLPTAPMAVAAIVPLAVTVLGLIGWLTGMDTTPVLNVAVAWPPGWVTLIGAGASAAVIAGLYSHVLSNGQKPMPPARYGDLPSVLKSLYLQQRFADFAVTHQGSDPATLHEAFGSFLETHRPSDKLSPSQAPGVISASAEQGLIK